MGVKLRLARGGSKKRPHYSIVAADIRAPRDGKYLEKLGTFNPLLASDNSDRVLLNEDRLKYWLGVGALPTDRVARFLSKVGLFAWKPSNNPQKAKLGKKAQERLDAQQDKRKVAEEKAAKDKVAKEKVAEEKAAAPVPAPSSEDKKEKKSEDTPVAPSEGKEDKPKA